MTVPLVEMAGGAPPRTVWSAPVAVASPTPPGPPFAVTVVVPSENVVFPPVPPVVPEVVPAVPAAPIAYVHVAGMTVVDHSK